MLRLTISHSALLAGWNSVFYIPKQVTLAKLKRQYIALEQKRRDEEEAATQNGEDNGCENTESAPHEPAVKEELPCGQAGKRAAKKEAQPNDGHGGDGDDGGGGDDDDIPSDFWEKAAKLGEATASPPSKRLRLTNRGANKKSKRNSTTKSRKRKKTQVAAPTSDSDSSLEFPDEVPARRKKSSARISLRFKKTKREKTANKKKPKRKTRQVSLKSMFSSS